MKKLTKANAAGDETTRLALEHKLEAVAAGLRQDITDASGSLPAALIGQLTEQGQLLAAVSAEIRGLTSAANEAAATAARLDERLVTLERTARLQQLLLTGLMLLAIVILVISVLILRHRASFVG